MRAVARSNTAYGKPCSGERGMVSPLLLYSTHMEDRTMPQDLSQTCGAKARHGTPCALPCGWGTRHLGEGRYQRQGGATPTKHGKYSRVILKEIK